MRPDASETITEKDTFESAAPEQGNQAPVLQVEMAVCSAEVQDDALTGGVLDCSAVRLDKEESGAAAWMRDHKAALLVGGGVAAVVTVIAFLATRGKINPTKYSVEISKAITEIKKPNLLPHGPVAAVAKTLDGASASSLMETAKCSSNILDVASNTVAGSRSFHCGPFDVSPFVRTLPSGQHASAAKLEEAALLGIKLGANQTFVKGHTKNLP